MHQQDSTRSVHCIVAVERRNTRCSKYHKNTEHNGYGGVPWECAQTVFGKTFQHRSQSCLYIQGPHNIGHARLVKYYIYGVLTVPQTPL